MNRYDGVRRMKRILVAVAVLIVGASLLVSHRLITDLKAEEQTKMGVWAEAMRSLTSADETTDLNLVLRVINDNHTIPVIVDGRKRNGEHLAQPPSALPKCRGFGETGERSAATAQSERPHDAHCPERKRRG